MSTTDPNINSLADQGPDVFVPAVSDLGEPQRSSGIQNRYPTTEAQLEVWLASQQSDASNCAYNEVASIVFQGKLDSERLHQAIDRVIKRHASLRSTFSEDGQEVLVHESLPLNIQTIDISGKSQEQIKDALNAVVQNESRTPFQLTHGPLLRVVLQKIGPQHHKLTFTAHHIILDGWSLAVFCKDLGHFYDTLCRPEGEQANRLLPPANTYDQYAKKMQTFLASSEGQAAETFWTNQFADRIPVLDLPIERNRPNLRTYFGRRLDHLIASELAEEVRKVGAKSGCSLFNTMLAAFNAYVSRISGNDDFCIGIPTAGQAALDQPELIGMCVNTMPLRTKVDISLSFADYAKQTRTELLNAFDHQKYSYGTLLRKLSPPRDPSRPPMLNVSFNIDPTIDTRELGFVGLDVQVIVEPRSFENFEWFINGVIQADQSIEMQVQYNADLFSAQSMKFYMEGFEAFLRGLTLDPSARIADLPLMSIPQRQKVIVDWNQTDLVYPTETNLHAEFARQAAETPTKVAVAFEQTELTYKEVDLRSNQIARYLISQGVKPGDLVGICVERSAEMLVYLYGILKTGAGYVPLDPAYPCDRLQYMCEHSRLSLVVTQSGLESQVSEFGKEQLALDSLRSEIDQLESGPVATQCKPTDTCYVIYTSGSTGKPKGVQVPHGTVVNFLYAMKNEPGFTSDDRVLAVTTLSFDIAVLELYLPTVFGGQVVIADYSTSTDGKRIADALNQYKITVMQATPATWRMLLQSDWSGKQDLKVLCGGEPMPPDIVGPLVKRCDQLWNMYGPTETTVWSAAYPIKTENSPILIGKPIGNTQIYILDSQGNEVPVGCEGEIYLGGAGVTFGYLNQQDMTDERFVRNRYRNPFKNFVSDRLYKTGDVGRYRFDGNIQFIRRNDKQVKVRGFRIELGEIEQAIKSHTSVQQTVAVVREDTPGDARLVAYLVSKTEHPVPTSELRDHLRKSLPYYMVPQHFVSLESMPQTNNGKIDYKALPEPSSEPNDNVESIAEPETPPQKYLASVWEEILELDDVGLDDTFFDIGGHSLLVMKAISIVHAKTGIKLNPQDFLISTLEQMATKISESFAFQDKAVNREGDDLVSAKPPSVTSSETFNKEEADATQTSELRESSPTETSEKPSLFRTLKGFWD